MREKRLFRVARTAVLCLITAMVTIVVYQTRQKQEEEALKPRTPFINQLLPNGAIHAERGYFIVSEGSYRETTVDLEDNFVTILSYKEDGSRRQFFSDHHQRLLRDRYLDADGNVIHDRQLGQMHFPQSQEDFGETVSWIVRNRDNFIFTSKK